MPVASPPHFERLLIVAGPQNAGKSRLLRTMYLDPRFGTMAQVPTSPRLAPVALSRERGLYIRCTSPHEYGETLDEFFGKLIEVRASASHRFRRFNYACAMQPFPANKMPSVVDVCDAFRNRLNPERMRLIQIHRRQDGQPGDLLPAADIDRLRAHGVELFTLDGRRAPSRSPHPHGLMLADYFDFT